MSVRWPCHRLTRHQRLHLVHARIAQPGCPSSRPLSISQPAAELHLPIGLGVCHEVRVARPVALRPMLGHQRVLDEVQRCQAPLGRADSRGECCRSRDDVTGVASMIPARAQALLHWAVVEFQGAGFG